MDFCPDCFTVWFKPGNCYCLKATQEKCVFNENFKCQEPSIYPIVKPRLCLRHFKGNCTYIYSTKSDKRGNICFKCGRTSHF